MHDNTYVHSLVKLSQTNPSMRYSLVKVSNALLPYVSNRDTRKDIRMDELGNRHTFRNWQQKEFAVPASARAGSVGEYLAWMDQNAPDDASFGRRLTPLSLREKLHPLNWFRGSTPLTKEELRFLTGQDHSFTDLTKNPSFVQTPDSIGTPSMTLAAKVELDRRRGLSDDQIKAIHNVEDLPESPFGAPKVEAPAAGGSSTPRTPGGSPSVVKNVAPAIEGAENLVAPVKYNPSKLTRNLDKAIGPLGMLAGLGVAGAVGRSIWKSATEPETIQQYTGRPGSFSGPGTW